MDEQPKRRWFRFRLTTVLILTAIVAWGMSCFPRAYWGHTLYRGNSFDIYLSLQIDHLHLYGIQLESALSDDLFFLAGIDSSDFGHEWWIGVSPKRVAWPALALLCFLAWKAAWTVVERRRRRAAAA